MTSSTTLFLDVKPGSGCDYHRISMPYGELNVQPKVPTIVFNRVHRLGFDFLRQARASGHKIVCDLDDLPILGDDHYLAQAYVASNMVERIVACMSLAHVITVTTQTLADEIMANFAIPSSRIVVIPNALPFDRGQFVRNSTDSAGEFIYAGGASHYRDTTLLPKLGERLTFAGYQEGHEEWDKIQQVHHRSHYMRAREVTEYMGLYEGYRCALAPLRATRFNRCKSNLKILEAGAVGIPIICSPVEPYLNKLDSPYVLYAYEDCDWTDWTEPGSGSFLSRVGAELSEHVRKHYHLDNINRLRAQLLESFS